MIIKKIISRINNKKEKAKIKKLSQKYDVGLKKSRNYFSKSFEFLKNKNLNIDEDLFDNIEEVLINSDISIDSTIRIIDATKKKISVDKISDPKKIKEVLIDNIFLGYLSGSEVDSTININTKPTVFLICGINGSGKTTSINKIAYRYKQKGKKVMVIAADTYRSAAVEQLNRIALKHDIYCHLPKPKQIQPASVIYDGLDYGIKHDYDIIICDTSGRMQTNKNLMVELKKIREVIVKKTNHEPNECLLVIDGTTGQNGLVQAKIFNEYTNITGIILTKIDGTSKGGIVLSIQEIFNIPVKFIGFGEGIEDIKPFDIDLYIYNLVKDL